MQQHADTAPTSEYDPRVSTSQALTEARTVRRRAMTALKTIGEPGMARDGGAPAAYNGYLDHNGPDLEEIRARLAQVVELLEPWARTGR